MSLRLSWLSSLPYLPRVCLYPMPFTDPWSGHSSVIPWIGGPSSGGCFHGNCRGNRRQTRGHGRLPGVKTLDERQRQRYNHGPCGTGVPWDKKKCILWGNGGGANLRRRSCVPFPAHRRELGTFLKLCQKFLPGFRLRWMYSEGFIYKSLETGDETINWLKSTHKNY